MNVPKISVIIPCYNLGEFLDEAVESVLSQSFHDFEIIIVDDGSTDEATNRLLRAYHKPKTKILWTENQGLPTARNTGIKASQGEYICCLDADDKYHPDFLKKSAEVLDRDHERNLGFVTTWFRTFGEEEYEWRTRDYDPPRLAIENIIHVASLFRRECWEKTGGYAPNLREGYEDWNFWISIVALGYHWRCVEEMLFYYRKRKGSMLSSSDEKRTRLFSTIIRNNLSFYEMNLEAILLTATAESGTAWKKWQETNDSLIAVANRLGETEGKLRETEGKLRETEGKLNVALKDLDLILHSFTWQTMTKIAKIANRLLPIESSRRKVAAYVLTLPLRIHDSVKAKLYSRQIVNDCRPHDLPLVSIVIPCYNYGAYIEGAIDSVLHQTFQNFEIIVVEGGSTDASTVATLQSLQKPKTNIYFRSERHLAGSNRNFGIEKARGKYVCCLDADDLLRETYLQKALFYLETYNYDVVYPSVQCFGDSDIVWVANSTDFLDNIQKGNAVSTTAVFKKSAWLKAGGYKDWPVGDGHVPEDWEFWTRLMGNGFRFKRLNEPLMLYRVHRRGLTAQCETTMEEQRAIIESENEKLLCGKNLRFIRKRNRLRFSVKAPWVNLKENRQPDRKNILFLLPWMIVGGADRVLLAVARYLSQNGYRALVLTTQAADEALGDNTREYEKVTGEVYHLDAFTEKEEERIDFTLHLIEVKNVDIIFLVGSEFGYRLLPEVRKRYPHVRIVDQLFNEFGHIANNRMYSRCIDLNIVTSEVIKNILINEHKESVDKIDIIVHGVDTEMEFNPENTDLLRHQVKGVIPDGKFVVSFAGRFSIEKAPAAFVDIAYAFRNNDNMFFVMTGNGPEYLGIKNKIKDLGLESKFYAPGFIDDIRPVLKRTDTLIIPSEIEGLPIILLEALSMGIPVIASAIGGIPSVIRNGYNGFLCEKGDIRSFIETVSLLYGNRALKDEVAKNARSFAVDNINIARMNNAYLDAFNTVLSKQTAK